MMATVAVGTLAFAALGGIDVLGFGSEAQSAPLDIVETSPSATSVDGLAISVDTTTTLLGEQPATGIAPEGTTVGGATGSGSATPGAVAPRASTPGATAPATAPATTPASAAPPTVAPTTPATAAPTTVTVPRTTTPPVTTAKPPSSTLPPGVSNDWPPGKPIPPKPVGCIDGQLEDNGVWNCQD